MKVPTSALGQFLFFAILEAISFFIVVANTRAIAQSSYFWTGITDIFFGLQAFAVFKWAVDDPNGRTWAAGVGSTIGGTVGSLFSIWATKVLYN